jgi:hypothetical protein
MAILKNTIVSGTGSLTLPSGTTANRPAITSTVQSFTTVGTTSWTAPTGVTQVEVLVVAGGGGGGARHSGGGGAGGLIYNSAFPVVPGTSYTVTVGAGGIGGTETAGFGVSPATTSGSNSIFGSLTAIGGGAGGSNSNIGSTGGSGGGAGDASSGIVLGSFGTVGQGNRGGNSADGAYFGGGGGGGAGGPGSNGSSGTNGGGGGGGIGLNFSISGTPTWYAGGGGGAAGYNKTSPGGAGGLGGGGRGDNARSGGAAITNQNGVANTGGGGGGQSTTFPTSGSGKAGDGGSGIVIIRYSVTSDNQDPRGLIRYNTDLRDIEIYEGAARSWSSLDPLKNFATSPSLNFVTAKIFSTFNGLRSSNYTVQYSDNGTSWTTAFSGVMSNNSSFGIQLGTVTSGGSGTTGNGSWGARAFWRYVEGSAVVGHHPRTSRIILTDINGIDHNIVVYSDDNIVDRGEYIIGTRTIQTPQGTIGNLGGYRIHTYTTPGIGNFIPVTSGLVEVLVVAGGGGGGHGGGGGGGVIYNQEYPVTAGTVYTVRVGNGGAGGISGSRGPVPAGSNGENSVFGSLIAIGGGGGGRAGAPADARAGGSGGGGSGDVPTAIPAAGTIGQGFPGGVSGRAGYGAGGGGGGAGGPGSNGRDQTADIGSGGNGGPGLVFNISGTPTYYGGGGGGGSNTNSTTATQDGLGGLGGGGIGARIADAGAISSGAPNTGGGGGGAEYEGSVAGGAAGGSGIVIVRYRYN